MPLLWMTQGLMGIAQQHLAFQSLAIELLRSVDKDQSALFCFNVVYQ